MVMSKKHANNDVSVCLEDINQRFVELLVHPEYDTWRVNPGRNVSCDQDLGWWI
ncbi:hypothetical protein DPMN_165914 [Dreissena polymorpha]|uniref:Uncharacterized protein n=1 Tax=Dreissena polymorpha TaxID=45954 RepID=A0A9D4F159_DREPO|nr:hypothetical protein DPMN_165914 [Dreissena polymorpha]